MLGTQSFDHSEVELVRLARKHSSSHWVLRMLRGLCSGVCNPYRLKWALFFFLPFSPWFLHKAFFPLSSSIFQFLASKLTINLKLGKLSSIDFLHKMKLPSASCPCIYNMRASEFLEKKKQKQKKKNNMFSTDGSWEYSVSSFLMESSINFPAATWDFPAEVTNPKISNYLTSDSQSQAKRF